VCNTLVFNDILIIPRSVKTFFQIKSFNVSCVSIGFEIYTGIKKNKIIQLIPYDKKGLWEKLLGILRNLKNTLNPLLTSTKENHYYHVQYYT